MRAGAIAFTHLGNACPPLLDRRDNILWRVLDTPGLRVTLIPDGAHVAPALFRLIHKVLSPERISYISDAMSAAGLAPGRYRLGRLELEVGRDKVVRLPGTGNLAGSAVSPLDCVFRATAMLGCPWADAWRRLSEHPAQFMGLPARPAVGAPAEFCLLEFQAGRAIPRLITPEAWNNFQRIHPPEPCW